MINDVRKDTETRMQKCVDNLHAELAKLRTGRAHPSLLEHIRVDYYGSDVPVSQVANVTVSDARTLTVTPWEKNMVAVVEKAIMTSDLGLNPATVGQIIRVPLPALTEDRRKELIKVLRAEAEKARVAIRNVRRDALGDLKDLEKEKAISEDDERRAGEEIQKLTDKYVAAVEKELEAKEKDVMAI
ncbi:MAG: ribosome recycling factor [Gammaproteobacteria bacterium CG11_big_fil_rev_8_21_14_0_20_46_22]|nr:MAG: ribosome recycling factor [Gammaproteobacteria bacterium CG12_big_fil_rev_8_21_14_0_65_46_12]PIR11371.1 MAG: ribosome recycling factor [Gammaproteobacteria bacterium CG11_big_fil_rev_8_21_14_0_20_46_22]